MTSNQISSLIQLCLHGDHRQQIESLDKLVDLNAQAAIPTLMELLSTENEVLLGAVATTLGQLGLGTEHETLIGETLIQLISHPEETVRIDVVDALSTLQYMPALEAIKFAVINDLDATMRASAAEALGDLGAASSLDILKQSLLDSDTAVRSYSANSFGLIADINQRLVLDQYLEKEPEKIVKAEILGAQCRLGSSQACIALIDYINTLTNYINTADDYYISAALNLLEDLLSRRQPSTLIPYTSYLSQALIKLQKDSSLHQKHIDSILIQLNNFHKNIQSKAQ